MPKNSDKPEVSGLEFTVLETHINCAFKEREGDTYEVMVLANGKGDIKEFSSGKAANAYYRDVRALLRILCVPHEIWLMVDHIAKVEPTIIRRDVLEWLYTDLQK